MSIIALVTAGSHGVATNTRSALEGFGHVVTTVFDADVPAHDFSGYDVIVTARSIANAAALRSTGKPMVIGLSAPAAGGNFTGLTSLSTNLNLTETYEQADNSQSISSIFTEDTDHFVLKAFGPASQDVLYQVATYGHALDSGSSYVGDLLATGQSNKPSIADQVTMIAIPVGTLDLLGQPTPANYIVSATIYGSIGYQNNGRALLGLMVAWVLDETENPVGDSCGAAFIDPIESHVSGDPVIYPYTGPGGADWWDIVVTDYGANDPIPYALRHGSGGIYGGNALPSNGLDFPNNVVSSPFQVTAIPKIGAELAGCVVMIGRREVTSGRTSVSIRHWDPITGNGFSIESPRGFSGSPVGTFHGGLSIYQWIDGVGTEIAFDDPGTNDAEDNRVLKFILSPEGILRGLLKFTATTTNVEYDVSANIGPQVPRRASVGWWMRGDQYVDTGAHVQYFLVCSSDVITMSGLNPGERLGVSGNLFGAEVISDENVDGVANVEAGVRFWPADTLRVYDSDGSTVLQTFSRAGFPIEYQFWGGQTWTRAGSLTPCPALPASWIYCASPPTTPWDGCSSAPATPWGEDASASATPWGECV